MQKILILCLALFGFTALGQDLESYQLNTAESVIHWKGSYSFLFSEHTGTVHFKEGNLHTKDGNVTGGSFIIDMMTISNEEFLNKVGPVEHLRNADFFDVGNFPEATLVFTSVEYFSNNNTHRIYADLTIKGITNNIRFYATVDGNAKTLESKFKIDRSLWGITYNNRLKNEAISDAIEFNVSLQFETALK